MSHYKSEFPTLVAVDCIIFGFDREILKILLIKRGFDPEKGKWSLMGGFLKKKETLHEAANRVLRNLTGLHHVYLDQLHAFSEINRDPVARTISVSYSALINISSHNDEMNIHHGAKWFNVNDFPRLIFDHVEMVKLAIKRLRALTSVQPIGFELLPEKFTMRQLQKLYEAILNETLDKRNFAKKIIAMDLLIRLNEKDTSSSKKGSYLYRFDKRKYQKKLTEGFIFKI